MQSMQAPKTCALVFVSLVFSALPLLARDSNVITRRLSRSECIALALQHNFDVKIARYSSEIRRQNIASAYGAYEPSLELAGTHFYNSSPGGIDEQDRPYPGTISERDAYRAGISAFLPTGLRLNIGGDLTSISGVDTSGDFESANG